MGSIIGDILTSALGIALSPIALLAAITLVLSPRGNAAGLGFLGGWLIGVIVPVLAISTLAGLLPEGEPDASRPVAGTILLVLGALLLYLAIGEWRIRPIPGKAPILPRWVPALNSMTVPQGLALGFGLGAASPKNLTLGVAAGLTIGGADFRPREIILVLLVWVVIAVSSMLVVVVGGMLGVDVWRRQLVDFRDWLGRNAATVHVVLFLVLGTSLIGAGISAY
ncbi:GAP family protein [Mycetocola miduiensis]|uniref:Sap, sulfolipid-1-addressing protein n=1 Tax=Mycetocola miduiensis TaxID=995034 RepID=A0A1I4Y8F8_9MICO|nr:GAP family protein [Mycetocola miduiensis]SFN34352.1 Sap, sulfolipid-1-addressing protein [Mycetocola miduiensis]